MTAVQVQAAMRNVPAVPRPRSYRPRPASCAFGADGHGWGSAGVSSLGSRGTWPGRVPRFESRRRISGKLEGLPQDSASLLAVCLRSAGVQTHETSTKEEGIAFAV